jgi:MFS family permease
MLLSTLERKLKIKIMLTLFVCMFATTVYQSIVSIAGPSIIADLGGFEYYAWLFSGFSLTSAVCAPFVGKLTKIYGPKKIIIPSLFIFLIATILCGLSTSMFMLIFFRSIQGIGLAGVLGVVWIMIALLWSPKERGKWLGATAAGFTLAGLIGPFLGAYITQFFGWRTAFFVVVPAILFSMLLILKVLPRIEKNQSTTFDYLGAIFFTLFASSFLFALSIFGIDTSRIFIYIGILFFISMISFGFFIYIELKAKEDGFIDITLFKDKYFSGGMIGNLIIPMQFVVYTIFVPLSLIGVYGFSPAKASIILIINAITVAIGANIFGFLITKVKLQMWIALFGFTTNGLCTFLFGFTDLNLNFIILIILVSIQGFAIPGAFQVFMVCIQNNLPQEKIEIVTSSLQFSRVFGISLSGSILGGILIMSMTNYEFEKPRSEIYDPDNITSVEKIDEIKEKYINSNQFEFFETDLNISRQNLMNGLRVVYYSAAITSILGILCSVYIFYDASRRQPLEEDSIRSE